MTTTAPLDIGETLKLGWADFTRHPVELIVGTLLVGLLSVVSLGICAPALIVGYYRMCLKAARGEPIVIGDVFSGFPSFLNALLLGLIAAVGVTIGLVLLVIPGLIVCYLIFWAFFFMADGEESPMACIKRSMEYNSAHVGDVLVFVLVAIVIQGVGGLVPFGSLIAAPVVSAMTAHAFLRAFPRA